MSLNCECKSKLKLFVQFEKINLKNLEENSIFCQKSSTLKNGKNFRIFNLKYLLYAFLNPKFMFEIH